MNSINTAFAAVVIAILTQLLVTVPILFTFGRTWLQKQIEKLNDKNQARHDETADKLDQIAQSITQPNHTNSTNM